MRDVVMSTTEARAAQDAACRGGITGALSALREYVAGQGGELAVGSIGIFYASAAGARFKSVLKAAGLQKAILHNPHSGVRMVANPGGQNMIKLA